MTLTSAEGKNLSLILSQVAESGEKIPSEFIDGLTEGNRVSEVVEVLRELIGQIGIREDALTIDALSCVCGGKLERVGETAAGWTAVLYCESEGCERIYHIDSETDGEEMCLNGDTFREYTG